MDDQDLNLPSDITKLAEEAGISVESLDGVCSVPVLNDIANVCDDWELIANRLLDSPQITAVKENNSTAELRRLDCLKKWRESTCNPTYRLLLEAFIKCQKLNQALRICKIVEREVSSSRKNHGASMVAPSLTPRENTSTGNKGSECTYSTVEDAGRNLEKKFSNVQRLLINSSHVSIQQLTGCVATLSSFRSTTPKPLLHATTHCCMLRLSWNFSMN